MRKSELGSVVRFVGNKRFRPRCFVSLDPDICGIILEPGVDVTLANRCKICPLYCENTIFGRNKNGQIR
jgi:hypothetical protein